MSLRGLKIVTGKEMAKTESLAFKEGCDEKEFMLNAGLKVAKGVEQFLSKNKGTKHVFLLAGKGNNAGDGYVALKYLLEKGISVRAFQLFDFDDCSKLCSFHGKEFMKMGGNIQFLDSVYDLIFEKEGVILDGVLGTGFSGELKSPIFEVVEKANASKLPILSIDCPSGLDTNTGKVESIAMKAKQTFFLGLPKIGFFISDGYNYVGELRHGDFGLPQKFIEKAEGVAYLIDDKKLKDTLPEVKRVRHKYQAGYVIGIAGSKGMGGAAKLSSLAALRSGAGMVRLFYPEDAEEEMENAPMELIREKRDRNKVLEAQEKAKAFFIGPGLGRSDDTASFLKEILPKINKPCVLDADALFFLSEHLDIQLPEKCIITPHIQEMMRLLKIQDADPFTFHRHVQEFSEKHQLITVLKGAPNFIFCPGDLPLVMYRGDPGMATAGTGDVLTGIIAALLAQGLDSYHAAILGSFLHALAGEKSARTKTSYSLIASDLLLSLPSAFKAILQGLPSLEII